MSSLPQRTSITGLVAEAVLGGARLAHACELLGFSERTLQRWQLAAEDNPDGRTMRHEAPAHKLSALERSLLAAQPLGLHFLDVGCLPLTLFPLGLLA